MTILVVADAAWHGRISDSLDDAAAHPPSAADLDDVGPTCLRDALSVAAMGRVPVVVAMPAYPDETSIRLTAAIMASGAHVLALPIDAPRRDWGEGLVDRRDVASDLDAHAADALRHGGYAAVVVDSALGEMPATCTMAAHHAIPVTSTMPGV